MSLLKKYEIKKSIKRNEALKGMVEDYLSEAKDFQAKIVELLIYDYLTLDEEKDYLKSVCGNKKVDFDMLSMYLTCLIKELKAKGNDLELRQNKNKLTNIIEDNFKCIYTELYIRASRESIAILPRVVLGGC